MGDAADALVDLLGHRALLLGGCGDLVGHVGNVGHRLADTDQRLVGLEHALDTFVGLAAAVFHGVHGLFGGLLQLGDQLVDLPGGFRRALRQLAYLIGDHGEAAAHLAGASGFDGGVERQEVGLVGNALDHIDHAADLVAVLGQAGDRLAGFAHRL
ncbi:hypothetical protein D3C84_721130 [compost metagenome]